MSDMDTYEQLHSSVYPWTAMPPPIATSAHAPAYTRAHAPAYTPAHACARICTHMTGLTVYIGCMYAGKSRTMLCDLERHSYAGRRCAVVRHSSDTRYDSVVAARGLEADRGIATHAGNVCIVDVIIADSLAEAAARALEYDCIGISEAQFYSDILLADTWAESRIVIAEGLDGTHTKENFGQLHTLIPRAERVVKLNAVCIGCGADAAFTRKIAGDMNAMIDIGGSDKYMPVCRKCWLGTRD